MMKKRTSEGIGICVKQAEILSGSEEEILWSKGLLGVWNPHVLLNTVVFCIGKGCALRAGQEHRLLRSQPFDSQLHFLYDESGTMFIRYSEDIGLKMNKGGLKHRKVMPKTVDVYPIENSERCPEAIISKYLQLLPKERKSTSFYLQPKKKFSENVWFLDRPVGVNKLRKTIKELCKQGGIDGFFTNHSLRLTAATNLYRNNVDEQLIQEITGHRSLAVCSYKRTSDSQHKMASNLLFN